MKKVYKKIKFQLEKFFHLTKYLRGQKKYNIGKRSYIAEDSKISNKDTTIGNFTSIGGECIIGLRKKHTDYLSSSGFMYVESNERLLGDLRIPPECVVENYPPQPVRIGNDVWIGTRVLIMEGVTVGDGSILGAGAIVTKDVPPYSIVVGSPAKVVKYRFEPHIVEKLLELKWWDYPENFIVRLPFSNIQKCIELLEENKHLKDCKNEL